MNQMFDPKTDGPIIADAPECKRDCNACVRDFEETQRQVEILRVALLNESAAHQESWLKVRDAVRLAIFDVIPGSRLLEEVPGESAEFRQGWDRCREEIQRRVDALLQVL